MTEKKVPHVHAELIKAWADGATIQYKWPKDNEWTTFDQNAVVGWHSACEYRVKPEPKPDVVRYARIVKCGDHVEAGFNMFTETAWEKDNLMLVFDGETGKLKDAQVLSNV